MEIALHAQHGSYAHHGASREAPSAYSTTDGCDDSLLHHRLDGFGVHRADLTQLRKGDLTILLEERSRQSIAFRFGHEYQTPMCARGLNAICAFMFS